MAESEEAVLSEITRILSEELSMPGPFTPAQHLIADLGLDSLGLTVLAVELENRFRIRLSIEDAADVGTVQDLVRLVVRAGEETPCAGTQPSRGGG